jgi:hypothetical protein
MLQHTIAVLVAEVVGDALEMIDVDQGKAEG